MKICSVIPSFNEARFIGKVVEKLFSRGLPVYVVDDGSSDETSSIAESRGAIVIRNSKNMGKGAALREGFERVTEDGFDAVVTMDGDGQHDVDDIPALVKKMEETGADMVIGNRMYDVSSMPLVRIATNRFMSWLLSKVSGQFVPDTQCGFRLIKCGMLRDVKLESSNYEIESEMIIKSARRNYKIESAGVKTLYSSEASKINPFVDTLRFILLMAKSMMVKK